MSGFVEVQFPPSISLGATGGAEYSTDIISTFSGWEQRNINWSQSRGKWNVASGVKTNAQMEEFIAFFHARRGRAIGFRFKDWNDYQVTAGFIATGDGSANTFQMIKQYTSGGVTVSRDIKKLVDGTVTIYEDGVAAAGWTIDYDNGAITKAAPASGVVITADFEFDVPVRFDTDMMDVTAMTNAIKQWNSIPVVELRIE